jgi:hypothetical protein
MRLAEDIACGVGGEGGRRERFISVASSSLDETA